ncbi:hypothetical protein Tco_1237215 [Tanacetum coccineum]
MMLHDYSQAIRNIVNASSNKEVSSKSFGGITQSGSGVSGASSSGNGFNQSGRVLIFGRWATPVSSESERYTSSGIGMSSTGCSYGDVDFGLEELEGASLVSEVF